MRYEVGQSFMSTDDIEFGNGGPDTNLIREKSLFAIHQIKDNIITLEWVNGIDEWSPVYLDFTEDEMEEFFIPLGDE